MLLVPDAGSVNVAMLSLALGTRFGDHSAVSAQLPELEAVYTGGENRKLGPNTPSLTEASIVGNVKLPLRLTVLCTEFMNVMSGAIVWVEKNRIGSVLPPE